MVDLHVLGLPGELKLAAKILKLKHQKLARPKKNATREEWVRYNLNDVESTRELVRRIHHLVLVTATEQRFREVHAEINHNGFAVDLDLAHGALTVVQAEIKAINAEFVQLTGLNTIDQTQAILKWLQDRGADLGDLQRQTLDAFDAHGLTPDVQRVIQLRQSGAKAAVKKLQAFINHCDDDGRVHDVFAYHKAHTGRSAGQGPQPQNVKRIEIEDAELETAITLARAGDHPRFKERFGENTLEMIGNLTRSIVWAGP